MKKALKVMKFGFFLSLVFILGLVFTNANLNQAIAKIVPTTSHIIYPYHYHYPTPYFSIFAKDKKTDNHKIILPTRAEVTDALLAIIN